MGEQDKMRSYEKLAKMVLMGVPYEQIGEVFGISKGRVSQITATDEYSQIAARVGVEEFEKFDTLNKGWDAVESLSVAQIVQSLQTSHDPDFALRAATLANKAQRRGAYNRPIGIPSTERTVRLTLNQNFVTKLNQVGDVQVGQVGNEREVFEGNKEDTDVQPQSATPNRFGFSATKPKPALEHQPARTFSFVDLKKKDTNFLQPSEVTKLLDPSTENKNSFARALDGIGFADAAPSPA